MSSAAAYANALKAKEEADKEVERTKEWEKQIEEKVVNEVCW